MQASLGHYVIGLGVGGLLGVALGVATGMSRALEHDDRLGGARAQARARLAWVPFAIIWFGVNPSAAVFIIAIGVFWIVFFAAHGAIRSVDRDLIEVADAFGFRKPHERLFKILLPAALPGILVGLRTRSARPGWRWWRPKSSACRAWASA